MQIKNAILYGDYEYDCKPVFFDPTLYYTIHDKHHKNEREAMEFDLNALRKSDLIIVNFNKPDSLGTAMELALAYEYRIPVVGLLKDDVDIHPWLKECATRICHDMRELVSHTVNFYLK